ncbi:uncharacterized protein A4U43_C07F26480 [Asparagus officinalis]|uniref:USP domain-containing protein n=1 Tax=Asparagus officinalis TaxID=4686 RepID=A0A5P1EH05_ASPOF|nr:uncharacterized protein A4U43_C07F26480 [Asparagus officinalis]
MAVARRVEVRRLAWLAAEEAARAEADAVASVCSLLSGDQDKVVTLVTANSATTSSITFSGYNIQQLAQVVANYANSDIRNALSGKCQIIHWRQGHKDECHPPKVDDSKSGGDSITNLIGLQTNLSDLAENNLEIETKPQAKQIETSSARELPESSSPSVVFSEDQIKIKPFVGIPETGSNLDSFADSSLLSSSSASSSSCSTFSGLLETSDDASANDDPLVLHSGKIEKASYHDFSLEDPMTAVQTSNANHKKASLASACSSVNSLFCSSNIELKVSSNEGDDVKRSSSSPGSSSVFSDYRTETRPSEGAIGSKKENVQAVAAASSFGASSNSVPTERSAKEEYSCRIVPSKGLQMSKISRPPSSFSSVEHESSNGGRHYVSRDTPAKNENASVLYAIPVETTGPSPNGVSVLKTSVRRAVQQLKSSNLPNHSSGPRSDGYRKYKMLFPYDLFIKLYNDKVELRPCGLTNCGNSCYANAVLQCLAFTRPLTSYLLQGLHTNTCPRRDWCFTCEFASLLLKAKQGQYPLSPIGILSNVGSNFDHGRQEDAHEFLRYAIDTMQSVCLKQADKSAAGTKAEETTLIQLVFGGYLRSKIKCTRCRGKSERRERMMDLTVEIHGDIGTLDEALARYTGTEILDGENKYHCSRCKSYERAKKKLTVLEAPNVLTIALKRFQSGKFGKLNKAVRFPEILDLAPYMSETDDKSPVYSLYAVVVHQDIMNAAFSGHYICYLKSTPGMWYKADDVRVKPVDIKSVLTKNAYMLFYARCSPRAPSLIRSVLSPNHQKNKRAKGKDSLNPQHRSYDLYNRRLPFPRTDSSSDSSSLLSFSDEGSCSTDSTRDSSSTTEELSDYIFGGSSVFSSEDSDGLAGRNEALSYEESLAWERREVGSEGMKGSPQFLCSDVTNQWSRKLAGDCRGRREISKHEPDVLLIRRLTRERSHTFY